MNEIELMYENAGFEKCNNSLKKYTPSVCPKNKNNKNENDNCEGCEYNWYPEFTDEKQLRLIIFLVNKEKFEITKGKTEVTEESLAACITGLINNIWEDLTDKEKEEIKEILK